MPRRGYQPAGSPTSPANRLPAPECWISRLCCLEQALQDYRIQDRQGVVNWLRMPAKRLLRDKDKKFKLLFEEHPQPMWIFDPESQKILGVNPSAVAMYGYSLEEFRGMTLADIQGPMEVRRFPEEVGIPARPAPTA